MEIDPELIVPDPSLSLNEGAILPWSTSASSYYEQMTQAIADKWEVDQDAPWEDLPEDVRHCFLHGTNGERIYISYRNRYGRRRSYTTTFEGIVPNLERRYRETDSDWSREKIEEYMTLRPCPECHGARLRPESLAVKVGGLGIDEFTRMSARRAIDWVESLELSDTERQIARHDPARDRRAAALPRQRRASATCRWSAPRPRCRAARPSGSGSPPRSARRWSACSTSSTSPRSACTSATTSG